MLDEILVLLANGKKTTKEDFVEASKRHIKNVSFLVNDMLAQYVDAPHSRTVDDTKKALHLIALANAAAHVMVFCIGSLTQQKYQFIGENFANNFKLDVLKEFEDLLEKHCVKIKEIEAEPNDAK